jgi:radical SAM superfamily enzyme YgiQ (UPF0313 family)
MKITFVYPGYFKDDGDRWISSGICLLSASIKQRGHESSLIDFRRLERWDDYREKLKAQKPQVIAITATTVYYPVALRAAEVAKELMPEATVVIGGVHATLVPQEVAANACFDYVITGEGEVSFLELLGDLAAGKKGERVVQGKRPDLDSLPFADRDLFGTQEYPLFGDFPLPFVTIISSRGCPYQCTFCQPAEKMVFGSRVRKRTVGHAMAELKLLREKYKFRSLMIHDDCLTADKEWVREFCREYKANGFNQPWVCQVKANHVCANPGLIGEMKAAGLRAVHIGFESGNQRILDLMKKGSTVEQNHEAYGILKSFGLEVQGMFMIGLPTETLEEARDTIRMIKSMRLERPVLTFFTPYPGTELYDYCREKGLLNIKDYSDFDRSKMSPKIKGLDYDELLELADSVMPGGSRARNAVKAAFRRLFGKALGNRLIGFVKARRNTGSHVWPLAGGQK